MVATARAEKLNVDAAQEYLNSTLLRPPHMSPSRLSPTTRSRCPSQTRPRGSGCVKAMPSPVAPPLLHPASTHSLPFFYSPLLPAPPRFSSSCCYTLLGFLLLALPLPPLRLHNCPCSSNCRRCCSQAGKFKQSYYNDHHESEMVIKDRLERYIPDVDRDELRQPLWVQLSLAEYNALTGATVKGKGELPHGHRYA
eukprot:6493144-Prymnesium_polylepis.1